MSEELDEYSFEQKERLARRIQKLKKQKYFIDIENIIVKYNPDLDITTNPHGKFMYFQDLKKETYYALEKYMRKIFKLKTFSDSDYTPYLSEIIKYSEDDDPFTNNPRLRYSNQERNIIKRKIYDKQINNQDSEYDNDVNRFISSEELSVNTGNEKIINTIEKNISQNNVFVKRKTIKVSKNEKVISSN